MVWGPMRRGDVYLADLGPARGSEAAKRRSVVVVSHDALNRIAASLGRGVVTVVPLTTNVVVVHPFQVLVPAGGAGLDRTSKAQAEQVRAIAVERLGPRPVGALAPELLAALDDALRLHLLL
jgi:mRNA interferase MazF